jgi:CHASE1-domain containing sensor protein
MYSSIPWVALVISLVVTTIVWGTILDLESQTQEQEFGSLAETSAHQIQVQLQTHEQVLMGFEGLFSASILVEPIEFTHFFEIQKINERFPDSQGVGYIEYVFGETEKNELIEKLKDEGLDYKIYPEGTRSEYYPVVFLEPQDFRNKRAIGYDVYSEEIRHQAIDQAIKTGEITLTRNVILVQETEKDIQNGFLMLLPVYEYVEDKETPQKFQGFVYSVFRMNDFIEGTLDVNIFENMQVRIYDGSSEPENLFYDSSYMKLISEENKFSKSKVIDFGGRQWVLDFYGSVPESNVNQSNPILVPMTGYAMSFLLFYTFILFSKNIRLTKDMLKKEKISLVGELASRFSHDIRNPLSNIKMAVELIRKKEKIDSNS